MMKLSAATSQKSLKLYPKLQLPPDIDSRDAIVICSGPSLDDYEQEDLKNCRAVLYGAGAIQHLFDFDHFIMIDHPFEHIPVGCKKIYTTKHIFNLIVNADKDYQSRVQIIPDHLSAGEAAISLAVKGNYRRIFVLGMDGLIDQQGYLRTRVHSHSTNSYNQDIQGVNGVVNPTELLQLKLVKKLTGPFFNLSTTASNISFIQLHPFIKTQKFGIIDRHASLLVVDSERYYRDFEFSIATIRERDPKQAILVLTYGDIPKWEIPDILYLKGPLKEEALAGFSRVRIINVGEVV